jgi:hypothetical protein
VAAPSISVGIDSTACGMAPAAAAATKHIKMANFIISTIIFIKKPFKYSITLIERFVEMSRTNELHNL